MMRNRKRLMWLLLAVLVVVPLSGAFLVGPVELLLWAASLCVWLIAFRIWARHEPQEAHRV